MGNSIFPQPKQRQFCFMRVFCSWRKDLCWHNQGSVILHSSKINPIKSEMSSVVRPTVSTHSILILHHIQSLTSMAIHRLCDVLSLWNYISFSLRVTVCLFFMNLFSFGISLFSFFSFLELRKRIIQEDVFLGKYWSHDPMSLCQTYHSALASLTSLKCDQIMFA